MGPISTRLPSNATASFAASVKSWRQSTDVSFSKSRPTVRVSLGEIVPVRDLQRRYATWALSQLGGHKGKTAEKLGIDAKTLWKWLNDTADDDQRVG